MLEKVDIYKQKNEMNTYHKAFTKLNKNELKTWTLDLELWNS